MDNFLLKSLTFETSFAPKRERPMDRGTILGIVSATGLITLAILLGGGAAAFLDLNSFLIVMGGTLGGALVHFPLSDFKNTMAILQKSVVPPSLSAKERIAEILRLCLRTRNHGILSLQQEALTETDPFFKKCLELAVDGHKPREVRQLLSIELSFLADRHQRGAQIFQTMGMLSPAMGLIGTLIGLIQMLQNLNNPATIGPAMAVALLTTFYGAVLSHLVFLPIAGKLRTRSAEEGLIKQMTVEGVIGIMNGLNPRLVEQRLFGFISPGERTSEYE